jgi:hypothetical protein
LPGQAGILIFAARPAFFPVTAIKFPVCRHREFDCKLLESLHLFTQELQREMAQSAQFPVDFPVSRETCPGPGMGHRRRDEPTAISQGRAFPAGGDWP